jgi:hypothetical protein
MVKVNVLTRTWNTYRANLGLVLLSAVALIISFLIPVFAALPTFNDLGGVFLRTSSIYLNLNIFNSAVIIVAFLFSLIFISFALVMINVVVKHSRTRTKIKTAVLNSLEKYTGIVFVTLLIYAIIVFAANILTYNTGYSAPITAIVALILTPLIFYAPSSIVIDEKGLFRAMKASMSFFFKQFDYFIIWLIVAILLFTVLDFVFIHAFGTVASRYVMLIVSSVFVLPFLMLMQGEMYLNRFGLLKV